MKRLLFILSLVAFFTVSGCEGDYTIHDQTPGEVVIIEVPVEVPVEVPGEGGEVWIDSFEQPYSFSGVDILWVIDRSGSMNDNDPELLAGIEAMMNALPPSGWRLNMTSASPPQARNDAFFPLVPGDDIADALNLWNNVALGHWEQGFEATQAYIEDNPYAPSWMRDDAALLVVFVSDEEEQSPNVNVAQFIQWYASLRPSVFLSSIVHVPGSSLCNPGLLNMGDKYIEATDHFGGVVIDICSDDWSTGVQDASAQVEPHEEWALTYTPIEDTIVVFVGFTEFFDWTYDSATNVVQFDIVPAEGSLVEIGYVIEQFGDDDDSAN